MDRLLGDAPGRGRERSVPARSAPTQGPVRSLGQVPNLFKSRFIVASPLSVVNLSLDLSPLLFQPGIRFTLA